MSTNVKENANLFINVLLLVITGAGGFIAREVYINTNETRKDVAVIQANQVTYQKDVATIQTDLSNLRTRIQANEIEIIKLQQKRTP